MSGASTNTPRPTESTVDPRQLRNAFGAFTTGVTVVTCRTPDGKPHGATVNAFTAVSLDPPLAQVTLIRTNKAAGYLKDSAFAINILSADQLDVCLNFAGKPMKGAPQWRSEGPDDLPVLKHNAATLECKPWRIYDGGDHVIVIGEVVDLEINKAEPLLFAAGEFREIGKYCGASPWEASGDSMSIGWFEGSDTFKAFS